MRNSITPLSGGVAWLALLAMPGWASEIAVRMTDVTGESGIGFVHSHGGDGQGYIVEGVVGGIALFDYDGDGFIDIYFLNGTPLRGTQVDTPPRNALYRNHGDGTFTDVTERAGVGARVQVRAGELEQVAEVHSGRGYQSHYGTRLSFGLGQRERVDRVRVRWPGGATEIFHDLPVDRLSVLTEGTGEPEG